MEILLISPEIAPFSGISCTRSSRNVVGEVVRASAKALRERGHRVLVVSPLYSSIVPAERALARRLLRAEFSLGKTRANCEVYEGRTASGVELMFIGHELFTRGDPAMQWSDADAATRAFILSRAALDIARAWDPRPAVIHAHDWQTALVTALVKDDADLRDTPTLLTIHNASASATLGRDTSAELGLDPTAIQNGLDESGRLNLLRCGVAYATRVVAASNRFATELVAPEDPLGLASAFAARGLGGEKPTGIPYGVDDASWNPATDSALPARYDRANVRGKRDCKANAQRELELPVREDAPLFVCTADLTAPNGIDLLARALGDAMRLDIQLAVLGSSPHGNSDDLHSTFADVARRFPDRLVLRSDLNEAGARRAIAGADFLVIPSREEPGGLLQLIAHRYGALPIARASAGIAETVVDCDVSLESGNGFLYDVASPSELVGAIRRAASAFADHDAFTKAVQRAMSIDHTWVRSTRLHERAYTDLVSLSAATSPGSVTANASPSA